MWIIKQIRDVKKNNGHVNFLKYSPKVDLLIFYQLFKRGMHSTITKGRSSRANFKWAWKDSELELFAFIASNKNHLFVSPFI